MYSLFDKTLFLTFGLIVTVSGESGLWSDWWSYSGISGPQFWGLLNKEWLLCSRGKHQSPVDINPRNLVFDPNLRPVRVNDNKVNGNIVNRGYDITLFVNESSFTFTGGPLSYVYRVHHITLHFGSLDIRGSEHTVGGKAFPMELQIYGFNSEVYANFSSAVTGPHGIAAIALFGMISKKPTSELDSLIKAIGNVPYKGNSTSIHDFSIKAILPNTKDYMTYEGSLTQPGCLETLTWIVFNKPIHIQREQLILLRSLHESSSNGETPPLLEKDNFRPPMPPNRRTIRTNLAPQIRTGANCGSRKIAFYETDITPIDFRQGRPLFFTTMPSKSKLCPSVFQLLWVQTLLS